MRSCTQRGLMPMTRGAIINQVLSDHYDHLVASRQVIPITTIDEALREIRTSGISLNEKTQRATFRQLQIETIQISSQENPIQDPHAERVEELLANLEDSK